MDQSRTPLTASSQFIQAGKCLHFTWYIIGFADDYFVVDDDDDLNDDDIPGFSHPALATASIPDKGKGRARPEPEKLAPPSASNGRPISPAVSGNIGSSSQTAPRPTNRQTVGGMQVETRHVLVICGEEFKGSRLRY